MAIVLFSNALTSEEGKQTDGNGSAIRPLFAPSATSNVADTNRCGRREGRKNRYLGIHQGTWEAVGNRYSGIAERVVLPDVRTCVRVAISKSVPKGRLNLAQDCVP
jgi:hypothetical protein